MIIEKRREIVEYFNICEKCGEEFEVDKNSCQTMCYQCKVKTVIKRAETDLKSLIPPGVYIESFEDNVEIEYVVLKLSNGTDLIVTTVVVDTFKQYIASIISKLIYEEI